MLPKLKKYCLMRLQPSVKPRFTLVLMRIINMMESMHKVNLGTKNCIVVVNDDG